MAKMILVSAAALALAALAACDSTSEAPVDQNRATWNDVSPDSNSADDVRSLPDDVNSQ